MSNLSINGDSPVPDTRFGPGSVGYAYLPDENELRVGLCVRHRPDGTSRLVFDLLVHFQKDAQHDFPKRQIMRIEVTLDDLPDNIGVLLGQRNWTRQREMTRLQGSDPWRPLPPPCDETTVWQGKTVSLLEWRATLRWPVSDSYPTGLSPPKLGIPHGQLAIWHGDEPVCIVNRRWLTVPRHGHLPPPMLHRDDEYTYYFPGIQP